MKVSPPSPAVELQRDDDVGPEGRDDPVNKAYDCSVKRRRLQPQTDVTINGHGYRHRKHLCQRPNDEYRPVDRSDVAGERVNSTSDSGSYGSDSGEDPSDGHGRPKMSTGHQDPQKQQQDYPALGAIRSPLAPRLNDQKEDCQQTPVIVNNNCNIEEDCITPEIRNAVQQLVTNNDSKNISISLSTYSEQNYDCKINKSSNNSTMPPSPVDHVIKRATTNEKQFSSIDTDFDDHTAVTANDDFINSDTCNDDCLSQSPLNLTRSQGSSERGNKSEDDDEGEFDDGCEEKNSFSSTINHDENIVNGHNLPTTDIPFPWNITLGNNAKQKQHQDDKVAAAPPQLLLTSGQLTTGCLQAAQLLIPTARGIMTQTILAIPINDMVSSAATAPTSNQQLLQQQLMYHTSNNARQKNINRQPLNPTCQPSLPINRYFQHQTAADETTNITCTPDNINIDSNSYDGNLMNNSTTAVDQYNTIQRKKWQSPDYNSKKHNFLSPQQKVFNCIKNGENGETMSAQHSNESLAVQTPAGTIGDCQIYSTNNSASNIASVSPISPPALNRNGNINGGVVDVIQRQTAWPTAITTTDQQNDGNGNDDEDELFLEDKQQVLHQTAHSISSASPTSSATVNTLKTLAQQSPQNTCPVKQSKEDDSTSAAAAAAAAYNQQNAICTALATHMLCASQLAAAQQPMFDNMEGGNPVKKPNHIYNNNNNNIKTNNMMGVVNPAALEKWMMEERYYYNNNNNNNKNIPGGHAHHQRYNAAAVAAAAVELLSGGVSASSSGGGGGGGGSGSDSLTSCKKRKRRTSFTPHALELLNGHFERNTHPSGSEITGLAHRLGYEREVIRIWFCNKRQALKNTVRTINGSGPTLMTSAKSHHNTSGY